MAESETYEVIATAITGRVDQTFATPAAIGELVARFVGESGGDRLAAADLARLDADIDRLLDEDRSLLGAGVVVAPGFLSDVERFLQWRQRQPGGDLAALILQVEDGGDNDPYEYPVMEWFRVPADEGRRMVGGPYFDYRGSERYALTFAEPIVVDGRFVGISGADQAVSEFERAVLPLLRQIPHPAGLLNHERRVVTANTPLLVTGQRVPQDICDAAQRYDVCPDLGWSLIVQS